MAPAALIRLARLPAATLVALLWAIPGRAQQARDTARAPSADTAARSASDSARDRLIQIGYGQRRAAEVTGALTQIDAPGFNQGRIVSFEQLIQDQVAGAQFMDNGEPGGGRAIRIRNPSALTGADPLYVVDGAPIRPGLMGGAAGGRDFLEFLDPDDIASITVLKDGAATAIYGMNAANGVVLITTKTGQGAPRFEYRGSASSSSASRLPDVLNAAQYRNDVTRYDPQVLPLIGTANTDWTRLVTQVAHGQSHHVALSGAVPSGAYRLSAGYLRQDGVLRTAATERLSLGLRYDQRLLGERVDLHLIANGARLNDRAAPNILYDAAETPPTEPVYDSTSPTGYFKIPSVSVRNPLEILHQFSSSGTTYRGVAHLLAGLTLPFVSGLRAQVHVAYDGVGGDQHQQSTSFYGDVSTVHGVPHHSGRTFEAQLTWTPPRLPVPGRWDFLAGFERARSHSSYWSGTGGLSFIEYDQDDTTRSFFGRLQYALADRYFASASLRRDHSSRFPPGHAWGTFPSVALAWRISREPLLHGALAGSDLTLRASWARTGDQGATSALASSTWLTPVYFNARWERATSYDVGLDLGLLGGRLSGSVDWYAKRTDGLVAAVPEATMYGLAYLVTNVGALQERGIEATLRARLLAPRGTGPAWTVAFTASHQADRVVSMTVPTFSVSFEPDQLVETGLPYASFYIFRQLYDSRGRPVQDGYVDLNGDGKIDGFDIEAQRAPGPRWILGHRSDLRWGAFDLSFMLRAYLGSWIYDETAAAAGTYEEFTGTSVPSNPDASVLRTGFAHRVYDTDYYLEDASFLRMDDLTLGWTFRRGPEPLRLFVTVQNAFTITGYRGLDPAAVPNGIDSFAPYPPARTLVAGLDVRL